MPRVAAKVAVPGEAASAHDLVSQDPNSFVSDPDAAIAAGRSGSARHIAKPRMAVAPAVLTVPDDTRTAGAPINATAKTTVADAMALDRKAKLQRPVMTEAGWYVPRNSLAEQRARRKNGEEPIVDID
jgi:hypothetical protein